MTMHIGANGCAAPIGGHVNGASGVNGGSGVNGRIHVTGMPSANDPSWVNGVVPGSNGVPVLNGASGSNGASGLNGDVRHDEAAATELRHLEHELAVATQRIVAARELTGARSRAADQALRSELEASRAALAELDRHHDEAVAIVRAAAQAEIERVLSDAHRTASAIEADVPNPPRTPVNHDE